MDFALISIILRVFTMLYLITSAVVSIHFSIFLERELLPYFTTDDASRSSELLQAQLAYGYLTASAFLSVVGLLSVAIKLGFFCLRGCLDSKDNGEPTHASCSHLLAHIIALGVGATMTVLAVLTAIHSWNWIGLLDAEGDHQQHLVENCRGIFVLVVVQLSAMALSLFMGIALILGDCITQRKSDRDTKKTSKKAAEIELGELEAQPQCEGVQRTELTRPEKVKHAKRMGRR